MTRNLFIFLATFVTGAAIALVARAAMFKPDAGHAGHPSGGGDYAPLVANTLAPAKAVPTPPSRAEAASKGDEHAGHDIATPDAPANQPVNSICAICGMDVDPNLPTAQYQGQTIGFGCRMCPAKFKADPDRWGPLYLENAVSKK